MKTFSYRLLTILVLLSFQFMGLNKNETPEKINKPGAVADSLTNIGHASMKIKTLDGKIIYIDPFQPGDYSDSADIVLITHAHGDHNQLNLVKQKPGCTVITWGESNINGVYQIFNIGNIKIYSVAAYNANHNILQCVGYVLEFNGIKLYHAGDTGNIPEMVQLADSNITYALLPVDGVFTMSPEVATAAAEAIQADFSIPMHTEPTPDNFNEDNVARFTPSNKIVVRHGETIALTPPSVDVEVEDSPILSFQLQQNYPNPFNPFTTINFTIPQSSFVTLKIFDINGSDVATLVSNEMPAGNHSTEWDAANMPSGIYFYRIQAEDFTATRKFVLMK